MYHLDCSYCPVGFTNKDTEEVISRIFNHEMEEHVNEVAWERMVGNTARFITSNIGFLKKVMIDDLPLSQDG